MSSNLQYSDGGLISYSQSSKTADTKVTTGLVEYLKENQESISLDLEGWNLGNKDVEVLSEELGNFPNFNEINLSENEIYDKGAIALSKAIGKGHLRELTDLDLASNKVGDEGAEALSSALEKCPKFGMLDLNENKIGDKGAIAFSKAIKEGCCPNLEMLYLSDNNISDEGARALIEGVKSCRSPHLVDLSLDDIKIDYEVGDSRNFISNEVKKELQETLKYITSGGCTNSEVPEDDIPSDFWF